MLRRIISKFYRGLPAVRKLQAVLHEHDKVTASLIGPVATMRPPPYLDGTKGDTAVAVPADLSKQIRHFGRPKALLDEDFAFAMRQAKEAAEQLTRSSKLQD